MTSALLEDHADSPIPDSDLMLEWPRELNCTRSELIAYFVGWAKLHRAPHSAGVPGPGPTRFELMDRPGGWLIARKFTTQTLNRGRSPVPASLWVSADGEVIVKHNDMPDIELADFSIDEIIRGIRTHVESVDQLILGSAVPS